MNQITILLLFSTIPHLVLAQSSPSSPNFNYRGGNLTDFEPSLLVVTAVISVVLTLTFILLIYAKCCHERPQEQEIPNWEQPVEFLESPRYSGLEKKVIESLPFFRFSSLKGSRQGLECSVCLSKFEDIEILRFLPNCKHAFHIECIDRWLEQHGTCPLCRNRVDFNDPLICKYSDSLRFLNLSGNRGESGLELFVEREVEEEEIENGSSRFSVGESFRKILKIGEIKETNCRKSKKMLHKLNHKVVISDAVFKNRWSNVSSSDLMFLNSQMLSSASGERFRDFFVEKPEEDSTKITDNPLFRSENRDNFGLDSRISEIGRRSLSEIIVVPRLNIPGAMEKKKVNEFRNEVSSSSSSSQFVNGKEEQRMRQWLLIARRTVRWYADRAKTFQQSQISKTQTHLDV